jgi:chromate transporter
VALFGWQVAGPAGAFASMAGICGPSSVIALGFEYFAAVRRTRYGQA